MKPGSSMIEAVRTRSVTGRVLGPAGAAVGPGELQLMRTTRMAANPTEEWAELPWVERFRTAALTGQGDNDGAVLGLVANDPLRIAAGLHALDGLEQAPTQAHDA